jgi:hypothetical protein
MCDLRFCLFCFSRHCRLSCWSFRLISTVANRQLVFVACSIDFVAAYKARSRWPVHWGAHRCVGLSVLVHELAAHEKATSNQPMTGISIRSPGLNDERSPTGLVSKESSDSSKPTRQKPTGPSRTFSFSHRPPPQSIAATKAGRWPGRHHVSSCCCWPCWRRQIARPADRRFPRAKNESGASGRIVWACFSRR